MRHNIFFILFTLLLLLFSSCGREHEAKKAAEAFLKENMIGYEDIGGISFGDLDSTFYLNEEKIAAIRRLADSAGIIRHGASYAAPTYDTLYFKRMNYVSADEGGKEDEHAITVYLDKSLTGVVAVRTNR